MRRVEDRPLLTGAGQYVADICPPGALHVAFLRSPHAHASILGVKLTAVRSSPGVGAALCGKDLQNVLRPIPMRLSPMADLAGALQLPLAVDRVRYVGEPVALVVAASRYEAEDALELIEVEYEPLGVVTEARAALDPSSPVLHAKVGKNLVAQLETALGDPEAAFRSAAAVVSERLTLQRHGGVPLETRGLVAEWDRLRGRLTVWGPTKVPHFNRGVLASLLDLPESVIRFIEPHVGGGFGARGEFYPEDFLIPYLARELERPIVWIEDRLEHLQATNHSRQQEHEAELAVDGDGKILGMRDSFLCDMGAYVRTHGVTVPSLTAAMLPGPYFVPSYQSTARCVVTNKTPTGTYRGPGRFEANFVRERLLDIAADRLGLDPAEIRRRNFVGPEQMPYDVGTAALGIPTIYDSGDYPALFEKALARFDLPAVRAEQAAAREAGRLAGVGIGCFVEKSGLGPWEYARLELETDGSVTLYSGCAAVGQGLDTILAQISGEVLGLGVDEVKVVHGDTDRVPRGHGAFASRGTVVAGSSAHMASMQLRARLSERAASLLEVAPEDLEPAQGSFRVRGYPDRCISFAELAAGGEMSEEAVFEVSHMAYPYGVHLVLAEVDGETGRLALLRYLVAFDVGRAVNPMLVEGQLVGALAQGIGGAVFEDFAYDASGQLLAGTFMDYLLPTVNETPASVDILLTQDCPSPLNPLGVKGAGEGGTVGASAAIANAVADALKPLGVEIRDLPLTPDRLRGLLREAKRG